MDLTGTIAYINADYITKKLEVTLSINEEKAFMEKYGRLKDAELLDIRIKKHREKRSLDANAYFHVLVGKLAETMRISRPYCKNLMIGRYGQPFLIDEDQMTEAVIKTNIPVDKMLENEMVHCMPCGSKMEDGTEVVYYRVLRGTSTYDTREMSILIDGTVSECKEVGIETLPPEELERMLNMERR